MTETQNSLDISTKLERIAKLAKDKRGVSLLTAPAESVVVQTPAAVGRTLPSTTAPAAPSQRRSSRSLPPLDVPLTLSVTPAGST